jgi:FkbM family methyltransferase
VQSRLVTANAAWAQRLLLKIVSRLPKQPGHLPLVYPRCNVATGGSSIASLYSDVFCRESYASPKPLPAAPRIIDAGGHLGMASLYFLQRYPSCHLTTLEPNPTLAALLRQTLSGYGPQVVLLEAALSTSNGTSQFHITSDNLFNVTGGIDNREAPDRAVTRLVVPQVDARDVLREPVDLMKLDVEGHEYELLPLPLFEPSHVRNLVVEFHDVERRSLQFRALARTLMEERGYRAATTEDVELDLAEVQQLTGCPVLKLF